jgi:hypothetical protein
MTRRNEFQHELSISLLRQLLDLLAPGQKYSHESAFTGYQNAVGVGVIKNVLQEHFIGSQSHASFPKQNIPFRSKDKIPTPIDILYVHRYDPYRLSIGGRVELRTNNPASGDPGPAHS